ncbi:hypothetical protein L313_2126 [Acinetobacter haemolyticus CIP 64.3 = MTCC 9819]|nr:hypothetical protein L313_2126 [Acinetobacter haemolyticus CIP 64.3 = MTCC 9819]
MESCQYVFGMKQLHTIDLDLKHFSISKNKKNNDYLLIRH